MKTSDFIGSFSPVGGSRVSNQLLSQKWLNFSNFPASDWSGGTDTTSLLVDTIRTICLLYWLKMGIHPRAEAKIGFIRYEKLNNKKNMLVLGS